MSLLSATELQSLIEDGVIQGVQDGAVNAASIDLHLAPLMLTEAYTHPNDTNRALLDLSKREGPAMLQHYKTLILKPGDFCLGSSVEVFNLPDDISGMFLLKSSMARAGLEHSQAGWCDAGWHGSALTLELRNNLRHHSLLLTAGMAIGQIVMFRHTHVPTEFSYATKGRYNGDKTVKGMRI